MAELRAQKKRKTIPQAINLLEHSKKMPLSEPPNPAVPARALRTVSPGFKKAVQQSYLIQKRPAEISKWIFKGHPQKLR